MSRPAVSVCMATYNGSGYVQEQIDSVLAQLGPDDELVVVDDASTDDTVAVLLRCRDPRLRLTVETRNAGYVATFQKALRASTGERILLADQDDVWMPGRVDAMVEALETDLVVASNLVRLDSGAPLRSPLTGRPWRLREKDSSHRLANSLRLLAGAVPYFGCAMGLRREVVPAVLPFPEWLDESHDLWLASVGNAARSIRHLEVITIQRRIHDSNASPERPRGVRAVIRSRGLVLRMLWTARRRAKDVPQQRPHA